MSGIYAKYHVKFMLLIILFILLPGKFSHLTPCVYFHRVVSLRRREIGFEVLVIGPAGPDIEPGGCTFCSILVFRLFF